MTKSFYRLNMTIDDFKMKVIARGITSVEESETKPFRRRGCLAGFAICKTLTSPEDFETTLTERHKQEHAVHCAGEDFSEAERDAYWEFRCATVQIEFVYDRMKVAWTQNGIREFQTLSAKAVLQYADIVGVKHQDM